MAELLQRFRQHKAGDGIVIDNEYLHGMSFATGGLSCFETRPLRRSRFGDAIALITTIVDGLSRNRARRDSWARLLRGSLLQALHRGLNALQSLKQLEPPRLGRRLWRVANEQSHAFEHSGRAFLDAGQLLFPGELPFGAVEQACEVFDILPSRSRPLVLGVYGSQVVGERGQSALASVDIGRNCVEVSDELLLFGSALFVFFDLSQRYHGANLALRLEATRGSSAVSPHDSVGLAFNENKRTES
jgi:hypothetical protein